MVAYEFYWFDEAEGYRINKSIPNWREEMFGEDLDTPNIYFIQVERDEKLLHET